MVDPEHPADPAEDVRAAVEGALFAFLEHARERPDGPELVDEIERVARAGGKRLRPAFCLWGYRAGGGTDEAAITRAAASLELLHTFAIIHDDIMDASRTRRGAPSTYRHLSAEHGERFGISAAILVGDLAMVLADEAWWGSGFDHEALVAAAKPYHAMRAEVIGGQYLDLRAAARGHATPEETRRISVLKSGRYTVERPLEMGAALAGASAAVVGALKRYGAPLGEAFQLRDDVLGAFGDPTVTGKDVDGDLREGKLTLLAVLARKNVAGEERAIFDRAFGNPDLTADDAAHLRGIFRTTGALDDVLATIEELHAQAREALSSTPLPQAVVDALDALAARSTMRAL